MDFLFREKARNYAKYILNAPKHQRHHPNSMRQFNPDDSLLTPPGGLRIPTVLLHALPHNLKSGSTIHLLNTSGATCLDPAFSPMLVSNNSSETGNDVSPSMSNGVLPDMHIDPDLDSANLPMSDPSLPLMMPEYESNIASELDSSFSSECPTFLTSEDEPTVSSLIEMDTSPVSLKHDILLDFEEKIGSIDPL